MSQATHLFVKYRGRITGPYSPQEIAEQVHRGMLGPIHRVSIDQFSWCRLHELPGWEHLGRAELGDPMTPIDMEAAFRGPENASYTPEPADDGPVDVELID